MYPNYNGTTCWDGDCVKKLKWDSNGSYLDSWAHTSHHIKGDEHCLRYTSDEMNGHECDNKHYYICEFQCPTTTTTSTSTTTSTFSKGESKAVSCPWSTWDQKKGEIHCLTFCLCHTWTRNCLQGIFTV